MRKIETEMNEAIRNGHAWSKDNTCITYDPTNNMSAEVYLHGNHIATVTDNDLKVAKKSAIEWATEYGRASVEDRNLETVFAVR